MWDGAGSLGSRVASGAGLLGPAPDAALLNLRTRTREGGLALPNPFGLFGNGSAGYGAVLKACTRDRERGRRRRLMRRPVSLSGWNPWVWRQSTNRRVKFEALISGKSDAQLLASRNMSTVPLKRNLRATTTLQMAPPAPCCVTPWYQLSCIPKY